MPVVDSFLALFVIVVVLGVASWALFGRRETAETNKKRAPSRYRRRSPWRKRLPVLLMGAAVVFLVLAFTQFQLLRGEGTAGTVVLVLDVSESMNRTDVEPNRLEAATAAARVFLEELPTDLQVGLVTFASEAVVVQPPTVERTRVVASLADLAQGEGTLIGDGLTAAIDSLNAEWQQAGEETPAAMILLSDGQDTGSLVPPGEAAGRAEEIGVPVHTVVLGRTATGEPGPNVALLQQIADITGGSAFTADTAGGLITVYQTLQTQISTELDISDFGALFIGIAAVFAIAATVTVLVAMRSEY